MTSPEDTGVEPLSKNPREHFLRLGQESSALNYEDTASGRGAQKKGPARATTFGPSEACTATVLSRSTFDAGLNRWSDVLRKISDKSICTTFGKGDPIQNAEDFALVFDAQATKRDKLRACLPERFLHTFKFAYRLAFPAGQHEA